MPRLSFAPQHVFRSEFAPEWFGAGAILLLCAIWAALIGFELRLTWHDGAIVIPALIAVLLTRVLGSRRFGLIGEYFVLSAVATAGFAILSYLSMTTGRPLIDGQLLAADRALGFDWLAGFHWLESHPAASRILQAIYDSLIYQGLYFGILFGLTERKTDLREMFWIVFAAGLLTSAGAALFPAFGTYQTFALQNHGLYLPDMIRLHSGQNLHFELARLTGVVSFPSFHTTMALAYIYGFRRAGAIGWFVVPLNLAMLIAIPFFGGHYLVDMLAGAAVMLAPLAIVTAWPRLLARFQVAAAREIPAT